MIPTATNCACFAARRLPDSWINRIWQEYRAGNLTRAVRDVLLTLHTFRGHGGAAWPSHATLADRARCCTRTVQRALQRPSTSVWCRGSNAVRAGWRWLRTSNLYRFVVPEGAVQTARGRSVLPLVSTTGHCVRGGESQNKKDALDELLREAAWHPDLLAMRRAAFTSGQIRRLA